MKRLLFLFCSLATLLVLSCTAEDIKNAIDQIKTDEQGKVPGLVGTYALDDGTGLTDTFISFDSDMMYEYKATGETKVLAEEYLWFTKNTDFSKQNDGKYSVSGDVLYCNGIPYGKIQIENNKIVLDGKTYTKFIGIKSERYSTISVQGELTQSISYAKQTLVFSVSVDRTIPSGKLMVDNRFSWISYAEIKDGILTIEITENNSYSTRTASIILSCAGAEDVLLQIQQMFTSSSINTQPYSQDVDYTGGDFALIYTIANPREAATITAVSQSNWITGVKIEDNVVSYHVEENNSGSSRTGYVNLSYGSYASKSFPVYQSYTGSVISFTPESQTVEHTSGNYSFEFSVTNPRESLSFSAVSQNNWITDVQLEGNKVSFKVKENSSAIGRVGIVQLLYGEYISKDYVVNQSGKPVQSLTINKSSLDLLYGMSERLAVSVEPVDAPLKWSSSNTSSATVSQSGVVSAIGSGAATITVSAENGKSASCAVTTIAPITDLSADGTSNCYIVSSAGYYSFRATKGNSSTSVGSISSASVLWESYGTSTAPSVGSIIKKVSYGSNKITFNTPPTLKNGNAVIVVKNAKGKILWSWHIWVCGGYNPKSSIQTYYKSAGKMMDRNLGATSATPGTVGALGLLYQWGRKDPFLGSNNISYNSKAASTLSWPSAVSSNTDNGTIEYAVAHPTTFIKWNTGGNGDWYYTGNSSTDDTRWQSVKTIYDPCPPGWRVPDGGSSGVWAKSCGHSGYFDFTYNSTNEGMNLSGKFGSASTIWYPAAGLLESGTGGEIRATGDYGHWWSCTPSDKSAYILYLSDVSRVYPSETSLRYQGYSVRCLQE